MLDGGAKLRMLRDLAEEHGLTRMLETGIYQGHATGLGMLDLLERLYLLDAQLDNILEVKRIGDPRIVAVCGDSAWTITEVLCDSNSDDLDAPLLVWLDAHLVEQYDGDACDLLPCPLLTELEAVSVWAPEGTVVAVDDLRMMGDNGWPTLEQLRAHVDAVGAGRWTVTETDDIMVLTPKETTR